MKHTDNTMRLLLSILLLFSSTLSVADDSNQAPTMAEQDPMSMLEDGDERGALEAFSMRALLGDSSAQSNLGVMYQRGIGAEVDLNKAFTLFELAAEQKNPYGQFNLAEMYERGDFIEKDLDRAMTLYEFVLSNPDADGKVIISAMAAIVRIQNEHSSSDEKFLNKDRTAAAEMQHGI